jgi:glycolate oxidase
MPDAQADAEHGREFLEALHGLLPADRVITRADTLEGLRRDKADILEAGQALAAAYPRSTAEVSSILELASRHRVPVVREVPGAGWPAAPMRWTAV